MVSNGDVHVVSGVGGKGTSYLQLSGGSGLGPVGAERLAEVLKKASPLKLTELDLRRLSPPTTTPA